jgi:hypothetical protein
MSGGIAMGTGAYQHMVDRQAKSLNRHTEVTSPSMEEMQNHAMNATQDAFSRNRLYVGMHGVSSRYMKKLNKSRPRYGYREWKDIVRGHG